MNSKWKRLARTVLLLAHFEKDGKPEVAIPKISHENSGSDVRHNAVRVRAMDLLFLRISIAPQFYCERRGKRMATRSSGETDRSDWRRLRMHCFGERTGVSGRGAWSEERGVRREFTQPGKPVQNAYVESFNGRLRDECLNAHWFTSLRDARRKIETWRQDYNQQCLHSSLSYLSPAGSARARAEVNA
jgi:transposase InsO family protein